MAWLFDYYVDKLEANYASADFQDNIANTYQENAQEKWDTGDYEAALLWIIMSVHALLGGFEKVLSWGYWGDYYYLPPKLFNMAGEAEEAKVSMRAIVDAMFTASNEELLQFTALTDAYRQSLWNKPFNVEYWAAVARGFEIWE